MRIFIKFNCLGEGHLILDFVGVRGPGTLPAETHLVVRLSISCLEFEGILEAVGEDVGTFFVGVTLFIGVLNAFVHTVTQVI